MFHCRRVLDASKMTIKAGIYERSETVQDLKVAEIIPYPEFDCTQSNDIALLRLDGSFTFGPTVNSICVGTEPPPVGEECFVSAWGKKGKR